MHQPARVAGTSMPGLALRTPRRSKRVRGDLPGLRRGEMTVAVGGSLTIFCRTYISALPTSTDSTPSS